MAADSDSTRSLPPPSLPRLSRINSTSRRIWTQFPPRKFPFMYPPLKSECLNSIDVNGILFFAILASFRNAKIANSIVQTQDSNTVAVNFTNYAVDEIRTHYFRIRSVWRIEIREYRTCFFNECCFSVKMELDILSTAQYLCPLDI